MHAIVRRQVKEGPPTGTSASPRLPPIGHHAESTAQIARKVGTQWSNHSQFNRDPDIWISVSDVVLWALAKDAVQAHQKMNAGSSGNKVNATSTRSTGHATGSTIQVWSCGCSSGEEVYYTRMMWLQRFQQVFPELNLEVLGTDISADVIAACKRGQYENHSVSVLPKEWQESFFDPLSIKPYNLLPGAGIESVNRDHQLFGANRNKNAEAIAATVAGCAEAFRAARREKFEGAGSAQANTTSRRLRTESPVRKCVQFLQQDNRKEMPDGPFDLITCRYALVLYTKENLWHHLVRLIDRLRVGGFLVIGKTESLPIGFAERFHLVRVLHPGNTSHSQDQIPGVFQKMTVDEKRTLREELESQQVKPAGASHSVREGKSTSGESGESNFIARLRNSEDFSTSAGSSDSSDGTSLKKRSQSLNGVDNDEHRIAQQRQAMERHQENGRSRSKGKHGAGGGASGAAPVDQHSRPTTSSGTTSKNVTAPADNKNVSAGFFEPTRSASVASLAKAPVRSQSLNSVSFGSGDASGKRQLERSLLASRAWRKPLQKPVFFVPVEDTTATDPRLRSATYANFVRKYVGGQPDWVRYQKQALAHIGRPRVPMLDRSKEILNAKADRQRGRAGGENLATGEENLQKTMSIYERATIKAANLMKNSSAGGGGGDAEMSTNAGSDTHRRRDGESSSSADDSDHTPVGGAGTRSVSASRTTGHSSVSVNNNSTAPGPSKPPFYAGNANKAQELIHGKTGGYASVAGGYNKDREGAAVAPQGQEQRARWSADVRVSAKEHITTSITTSAASGAGDGNKDSSGSGATSSATAERNAASSRTTKPLVGNTLHASRSIPNAAPGQSGGSTYTYMRRSVSHTAGASSSTTGAATSTSAQHPNGGYNYAGGSAAASTTTGGDLDMGGAGALGSKKADYSHVRPKIDNKPPESTKRSHSEQPEGAGPTRVKQTPRTANIYRNPPYRAHTKTDAGASNNSMSSREHKLATHRPIMGSKDPRTALLAEIGEVEKTLSNLEAQHQQRDDKVKSSEVKYGRGPPPRMERHRVLTATTAASRLDIGGDPGNVVTTSAENRDGTTTAMLEQEAAVMAMRPPVNNYDDGVDHRDRDVEQHKDFAEQTRGRGRGSKVVSASNYSKNGNTTADPDPSKVLKPRMQPAQAKQTVNKQKQMYNTYGMEHLRPASPPTAGGPKQITMERVAQPQVGSSSNNLNQQYNNVANSAPMVDSVVSNLTAKHRPDRPPTPCRDRKRKKRASVYEIIDSSPLESGFANSSKNSSFATKYLKDNGLFDGGGPSAIISKKSPGVEYVKVPFTPTRVSMVSLGPGGGDPTFAGAGGGTSAGAVLFSGVQQQQLLAGGAKYPGATAAQTAYGGAPNLFSSPQLQELNDFEAWKKETLQSASNASTVKSLRPPKGRPVSPITKLLMKNHTDLTAQLNQKLAEDHVSLTALGTKYAREILSREDS